MSTQLITKPVLTVTSRRVAATTAVPAPVRRPAAPTAMSMRRFLLWIAVAVMAVVAITATAIDAIEDSRPRQTSPATTFASPSSQNQQ